MPFSPRALQGKTPPVFSKSSPPFVFHLSARTSPAEAPAAHGPAPASGRLRVAGRLLSLGLALGLTIAAVSANFRQIFVEPGRVFFVDADCYSRMTRVRAVCAEPGLVPKQHAFENAPFGTRPHTTVPFDYATAGLRAVLRPFWGERALDLAGAWISPLLGCLTVAGVWCWGERGRLPGRWLVLALLGASPILAHGFSLGRPDHQSLILACMALALAAEWQLWSGQSCGWGIASGVAWAVGLWTSLYEPLLLLALVLVAALVWNRAVFRQKARLPGLIVGGVILLLALGVEGWRIGGVPGFGEGEGAEYFSAWTRQIGELTSLPPWSPVLYGWTGLGLLAAPGLLWLNRGASRATARANLFLLAAVFSLTCWQVRWGYFLPLVYALSLPWQFGALPPRWRAVAGVALVLGLWPMIHEWSGRLFPTPEAQANLAEQRADATQLRAAADFIAQTAAQNPPADDPPATTILAPWWLSPPLAYWSGQPAVAGSSHEALAGTVEVARFLLATDARQAAEILRRRRVRWVVAYEPSRVQGTSADLLGVHPPPSRFMDLALYQRPEVAPRFLHLVCVNPYFKIYEVRVGSLPHE